MKTPSGVLRRDPDGVPGGAAERSRAWPRCVQERRKRERSAARPPLCFHDPSVFPLLESRRVIPSPSPTRGVRLQALTVCLLPRRSGAPPPDGPVPAGGPGGAGPGAHPSHRRAAAAADPEELPPVPVTPPTQRDPAHGCDPAHRCGHAHICGAIGGRHSGLLFTAAVWTILIGFSAFFFPPSSFLDFFLLFFCVN